MDGKEMFEMNLFDEKTIQTPELSNWMVVRVPGGWVMRERDVPSPAYVFVPLDNELC